MRLTHRIHRFERQLPKPVPQCAGCGYPTTAKLMNYVITKHANPLPTCPICHRPMDEDGTPIGGHYKRIILNRPDLV